MITPYQPLAFLDVIFDDSSQLLYPISISGNRHWIDDSLTVLLLTGEILSIWLTTLYQRFCLNWQNLRQFSSFD